MAIFPQNEQFRAVCSCIRPGLLYSVRMMMFETQTEGCTSMDNTLRDILYDILDDGITDMDTILFDLRNAGFGLLDEAEVFAEANAYLYHYGKCVEMN